MRDETRLIACRSLRSSKQLFPCVTDIYNMSPTILRVRGYRFYFFSREEPRAHVHVQHANGEVKFWLEPKVELAHTYGLAHRQLWVVLGLIKEHEDEIRAAWKKHFEGGS